MKLSDLTYRQKKVVEVLGLSLKNTTPKGWIEGGTCPFCGKDDKFGVRLNQDRTRYKNHISFNCFHGSCQEKGNEFKLLKHMNLLHLIADGEFIGKTEKVEMQSFEEVLDEALDLKVESRYKPFGFKRVTQDDYLDSRGFEPWQYELYNIGRTRLFDRLKNYVIFLIEEDGVNKGYVARLTWDNDRIQQYEQRTGKKVLRYNNEGGVDFGKLIFGIDEIDENTREVLVVEGVTDKANVDRILRKANKSHRVKCICTFGKKMSDEQIMKLWIKFRGKITLLYDPDAVNASKRYAHHLQLWFSNVKVGYLHSKDPGDLSYEELLEILDSTLTPNQFDADKVQKFKLN